MRLLSTTLVAICAAPLIWCGCADRGSSKSGGSAAPVPESTTNAAHRSNNPLDSDNDNDNPTNKPPDGDDTIGGNAIEPDRRQIEAVVERYFELAHRRDGARGCSLLYTLVEETVVENYGHSKDRPGQTCATALTEFFTRSRSQFSADTAKPQIRKVLVEGQRGWALFDVGPMNERRILVHRQENNWRIEGVFDISMP